MGVAMIISGSESASSLLEQALGNLGFTECTVRQNGVSARGELAEKEFDLVVINAPLPDEFGHTLCRYAAEKTGAGVVLLVKNEMQDEVAAKVEDAGVFVVGKPINRSLLFGALKLALASRMRLCALQKQNDDLREKINDIRLVDRAKCVLIQYRGLTEEEAHKLIEREAMDSRTPRRVVAQKIIEQYVGPL